MIACMPAQAGMRIADHADAMTPEQRRRNRIAATILVAFAAVIFVWVIGKGGGLFTPFGGPG